LKDLLDLKQRHANVEEARQANNILLATQDLAQQSALQTIQGNKQNRALMIFTIVTIIFVSLRALSSILRNNMALTTWAVAARLLLLGFWNERP